jgi:hypothetical protein
MQYLDAERGVECRAVPRSDGRGWQAEWRPSRAIRAFPRFSFMARAERFPTAQDAITFVQRNIDSILSGMI